MASQALNNLRVSTSRITATARSLPAPGELGQVAWLACLLGGVLGGILGAAVGGMVALFAGGGVEGPGAELERPVLIASTLGGAALGFFGTRWLIAKLG